MPSSTAAKSVFADTSFFFALAAKRDHAHEQATAVYARLVKGGRRLLTTDYVIDETMTLVKLRTEARVALALLERIEQSETVVIEAIDAVRFHEAKALFRRHADHDYSFTDCSSFVVMREQKLTEALTTDAHFTEAGFKALLRTR
jgi:predicted nucleic acid-binding protein